MNLESGFSNNYNNNHMLNFGKESELSDDEESLIRRDGEVRILPIKYLGKRTTRTGN
jgi:hypothetical protein